MGFRLPVWVWGVSDSNVAGSEPELSFGDSCELFGLGFRVQGAGFRVLAFRC